VAILPVYFYMNRVPENTDITLIFSQSVNNKPGIMISNMGDVTAGAARYVGFYWNLSARFLLGVSPPINHSRSFDHRLRGAAEGARYRGQGKPREVD
jgi:hypothetical protein